MANPRFDEKGNEIKPAKEEAIKVESKAEAEEAVIDPVQQAKEKTAKEYETKVATREAYKLAMKNGVKAPENTNQKVK